VSLVSFARSRPRLFWSLVAAVTALVYAATLVVYGLADDTEEVVMVVPADDEVVVIVTPKAMHPTTDRLDVEIQIVPGREFFGARGDTLAEQINLYLAPSTARAELAFPAGSVPTTMFDAQLMIAGQAGRWPFDRFAIEPLVVEAYTGAGDGVRILPTRGLFDGQLEGWEVRDESVTVGPEYAAAGEGLDVRVQRTAGTLVYALILLLMMVVLAVLAAFAAIQTTRRRRRVHTDMLGWMAAMLFAVVPMRSILPGDPPIGSWVDVSLTLWVVVTLVCALALYVYCWWRDTAVESGSGHRRDALRGAGRPPEDAGAGADRDRHDDRDGPPHVGGGEELVPHRPSGALPTAGSQPPVRGDQEHRATGQHPDAEREAASAVGLDPDEQQQRGDPDPVV